MDGDVAGAPVCAHARELPGCPEPPHPEFPTHLERFLDTVATFAGDG
jgi:hypothetical protein